MTLATDADQLLAAILHAPEDDAPRLAYADWLDENGQHEQAEFVRVQIRLATGCKVCDGTGRNTVSPCPCSALHRRERELIKSWWQWLPDCIPSQACLLNLNPTAGPAIGVMFGRGFINSVSAPLAVLFGGPCERCERYPQLIRPRGKGIHGCPDCKGEGRTPGIAAELFARQPVERVTLVDREPMSYIGRQHCWHDDASPNNGHANRESDLPGELWGYLVGHDEQSWCAKIYPTRDAALAALSAAAVRHGRQSAGLPAL